MIIVTAIDIICHVIDTGHKCFRYRNWHLYTLASNSSNSGYTWVSLDLLIMASDLYIEIVRKLKEVVSFW